MTQVSHQRLAVVVFILLGSVVCPEAGIRSRHPAGDRCEPAVGSSLAHEELVGLRFANDDWFDVGKAANVRGSSLPIHADAGAMESLQAHRCGRANGDGAFTHHRPLALSLPTVRLQI